MSANCVCPSSVSSVAAEIEEKEKNTHTHTHIETLLRHPVKCDQGTPTEIIAS